MSALQTIRLPLRIRALRESFVIEDAGGYLILAVYFEDGSTEMREVRRRITREEALACAQAAARAITAEVERASEG